MSFANYARRTIPRSYNPPKATTNTKSFDITTDLKPGDIVQWNNKRSGAFLRYEIDLDYVLCIYYYRPDPITDQMGEGFDQVQYFTLISRA